MSPQRSKPAARLACLAEPNANYAQMLLHGAANCGKRRSQHVPPQISATLARRAGCWRRLFLSSCVACSNLRSLPAATPPAHRAPRPARPPSRCSPTQVNDLPGKALRGFCGDAPSPTRQVRERVDSKQGRLCEDTGWLRRRSKQGNDVERPSQNAAVAELGSAQRHRAPQNLRARRFRNSAAGGDCDSQPTLLR